MIVMKTRLIAACAALGLCAATVSAQAPDVAALAPDTPAGTYRLDPTHASLLFRVDHMGFSNYTARFTGFDGTLEFDPQNPAAASLTATVDAASIETGFPFPEQVDFDAQLRGEEWLNAARHPQMVFRSTQVTMTGPNTARIDGALTFRGVTHPMALDATFNGGYPGMEYDPAARIGFSARGKLNRSDYGMSTGIPAPGTRMGVGDAVEVIIEAEFSGPEWQAPEKGEK
jgi:polyisoprenoid-binding protein YceI